MFDRDLAKEIIEQILTALEKIKCRFAPIESPDDFYNSESGSEKLDAICMQLIAIGEGLKNLDKITSQNLLQNYPEIDWKGAKAMRDIISHHYFDIDVEIVYDVCANKTDPLILTLNKMLSDITGPKVSDK